MNKVFVLLLFLLLGACTAGDQNGACIPNTNSGQTNANGTYQNKPEVIFNYLKEKKIISTIIGKIKVKLLGGNSDSGSATQNIFSTLTGGKSNSGSGAAENMFTSLTSNPAFKSAISAAFTLAIVFYGLGVATGIIQAQLGDALIRVGKILVIAFLASNWDFFYEIVGKFFMNATDEVIYYMLQSFGDLYGGGPATGGGTAGFLGSLVPSSVSGIVSTVTKGSGIGGSEVSTETLFANIDIFFAQIFSAHTFAIVSALLNKSGENAGPFSNVYALLLAYAFFQLASAILRVVVIYAFSLFAKALLFALAPIFFAFLLFNQTKPIFDGWVKLMVSFTLQPIFVMSMVGLFISVLTPLFAEVYKMQVCLDPAGKNGELAWRFRSTVTGASFESSVMSGPPMKLETILMLFFYCWFFSSFVKFAEEFAKAISQSATGNLGDLANGFTGKLGFGGGK